jgi:Spy/CpxP family protein refolding chaperone
MKSIATALALLSLTTLPLLAKEPACCAGSKMKMDCSQMFDQMNLTAEQKATLEKAQAKCQADGCTKENMDQFMKTAKGVLTPEQFAQLQSKCAKAGHAGKKS